MKFVMKKGLVAVSSLAVLLALGACGDRETVDTSADSSQVTGQTPATEQARTEEAPAADTSAMGASGDRPMGQVVDDAQIVAKIKSEFALDNDISALAIDVDSRDGVVTLTGTVPNSDAKVRADEIAKRIEEVRTVNNQLEVRAG